MQPSRPLAERNLNKPEPVAVVKKATKANDETAQQLTSSKPTASKPLTSFGELRAQSGAIAKVKEADVVNNSFEYRKSAAAVNDDSDSDDDDDCVVRNQKLRAHNLSRYFVTPNLDVFRLLRCPKQKVAPVARHDRAL